MVECMDDQDLVLSSINCQNTLRVMYFVIGRVSYLIYISMRHYVLTTSGDIIVCFHAAVCLSC